MAIEQLTGGCQCGAVRYEWTARPAYSSVCYCRMCQKASGQPFMALTGGKRRALRWTRGAPSIFHSSKHGERGFCSALRHAADLSRSTAPDGSASPSQASTIPRRCPDEAVRHRRQGVVDRRHLRACRRSAPRNGCGTRDRRHRQPSASRSRARVSTPWNPLQRSPPGLDDRGPRAARGAGAALPRSELVPHVERWTRGRHHGPRGLGQARRGRTAVRRHSGGIRRRRRHLRARDGDQPRVRARRPRSRSARRCIPASSRPTSCTTAPRSRRSAGCRSWRPARWSAPSR